jgi:hypothetical protein
VSRPLDGAGSASPPPRTRALVRHCVGPVLATVHAVVRPWSGRRRRQGHDLAAVVLAPATRATLSSPEVRPGMIQLPGPFDGLPVRRPPTTIEGAGRPARMPRTQPDGPVSTPADLAALDGAYVEGGIRRLEELLGAPLPPGSFDDDVIAALVDDVRDGPAPPDGEFGRSPGP